MEVLLLKYFWMKNDIPIDTMPHKTRDAAQFDRRENGNKDWILNIKPIMIAPMPAGRKNTKEPNNITSIIISRVPIINQLLAFSINSITLFPLFYSLSLVIAQHFLKP